MKHLELVQSVITRLAGHSFIVKGWAVTLFTALLGFALANDRPLLAGLAAASSAIMWLLDTYFLQSERMFRRFYARIVDPRDGAWAPVPLSMDATSKATLQALGEARSLRAYLAVMFSPTLRLLYGALFLLAVAVAVGLTR